MRFDNSDNSDQEQEGSRRSRSRNSSRSGSATPNGSRSGGSSRSNSPNLQIASDRSRSRSGSGSRRSGSRTPSRSRSRSRSRSANSNASNRSRSGSRSGTPASRGSRKSSKSRSRSKSPARSGSGSPVQTEKKKRKISSSDAGSGSDKESPKKKKPTAIIDTDSEGESENKGGDNAKGADELFGDADDISSDEDENREKPKRANISDDEDNVRRGSDYQDDDDDEPRRSSDNEKPAEKEPEPEPIPETRIDVEIPRIMSDLGKDIHFVILPNFLSVETRPFDQETYEDEIDEEETLDEEGRQRVKLKVSNTLRWREFIDDDGNPKKESNARIVKWSDGSMSLHLGNEIFDVYKQPLQGDHNHLFVRQGTGLQGQTVFRTKLTFRPHSTDSFTHKKMTMSLADRMQKTSGIKILTQVGPDPDQDRHYNLKKEEEKLRQAIRQKTSQWKPKRSRDSGAMNSSYRDHDEGSDEEGAISIAAIKNKYKKGGQAAANTSANSGIYSSDEDGSDFEARPKKNIDKSKALKALNDSDDSESGGERPNDDDGDDDDEDDE